jgi:sugar phosphate isomerase/epimerase
MVTRRNFALSSLAFLGGAAAQQKKWFQISLAEWSIHKAVRSGQVKNLDFPKLAREKFGIEGLEFVNTLWEVPTQGYVRRLMRNMQSTGTKAVLIMCDDEGLMGHTQKADRLKAAKNHYKWVDIAAEIGAHSIRTNMYPDKEPKTDPEITDYLNRCVESFSDLCAYGKKANINIIIENHGGLSSDPDILIRLMKQVNLPNFGVLPDFGNFYGKIDRYDAVKKLMPYAKGVSFKCYEFGPDGKETKIDMDRMMSIVKAAGYQGWVGIEFEGEKTPEFEGIAQAKKYLDTVS